MRRRVVWGVGALAAMVLTLDASAQLVFEPVEKTVHPDITATEVRETFRFTNTGTYPITLISVRGPEDCQATRPQKRTYQPGEGGEVIVSLSLTGMSAAGGMQARTVTFKTDQRQNPMQELILNVDIPPLLTATPAQVQWDSAAEAKPRTVMVEAAERIQIKTLTARVLGGRRSMQVAVQEEQAGHRYALTVTPAEEVPQMRAALPEVTPEAAPQTKDTVPAAKPTAVFRPMLAPIEVTAHLADGRSTRLMVMAAVRPKPQGRTQSPPGAVPPGDQPDGPQQQKKMAP